MANLKKPIQLLFTGLLLAGLLASCKDSSAPTISSFKINGVEIGTAGPVFNGSVNESATFQLVVNDDEELLQFIAFIDTTGLDDKERLYGQGLSGKEDYVEFTWQMRYIDSIGQRHFFGQDVPVIFRVMDQSLNTESMTVTFNLN